MEDLVRNISTQPQDNTDFEVLTSDSFSDKSSALDINGTLKISVLSGMVDVEGSGKYLKNTKESKTQARVTLKYKRTTRFDQLTINNLCQRNVTIPEGIATHVVTAILYGAQAFFIFDQKVTNSKEAKDIEGKLVGMVKKIGELRGEVKMNDTEREVVQHFDCKFQGDFALERNPTTYEEAVKICAGLPNLIGQNGEKAVPIKVWLQPLKNIISTSARLVREVSDRLLLTAEEMMQQMSEVIMECNDMMGHPAAITFPALANKIGQFKKLFERFRIMFQNKLSQVLPSVRGGNTEESSVEEILTGKEKSPFSDLKVRRFLDRRWTEMGYVYLLLKQLEKFQIVTEQRELIEEIIDPNYNETLCFNFSLEYKDLYLSFLESWLYKESWDYQEIFSDGETEEWFEKKGISEWVNGVMLSVFTTKKKFTALKRLVTSVACRTGPGISFHYYDNNHPVNYCTC